MIRATFAFAMLLMVFATAGSAQVVPMPPPGIDPTLPLESPDPSPEPPQTFYDPSDALENAVELIVLFDDEDIQREADRRREERGLLYEDRSILEWKARQYSRLKSPVFSKVGFAGSVLDEYEYLPMAFVRLDGRFLTEEWLLAQPQVVRTYPNGFDVPTLIQSRPLIGATAAADAGSLGAGTTVAVLDTGVDFKHSDFGACSDAEGRFQRSPLCRIAAMVEVAPNDHAADDGDGGGHGTNVAGIVAGVAPGAGLIVLDVFERGEDGKNRVSFVHQLAAINFLLWNRDLFNIVAVNMSFGTKFEDLSGNVGFGYCEDLRDTAFQNALRAGIQPISSAGNDGEVERINPPACSRHVIRVGSVIDSGIDGAYVWGTGDKAFLPAWGGGKATPDRVSAFSNSAPFLSLLAPGESITAAGVTMRGTSQAAPHVAGAWAVLRAEHSEWSLEETFWALRKSGIPIRDARNDVYTPRVQLDDALDTDVRPFDKALLPVGGVYQALIGDFNGDTRSDVFWYGPGPVTMRGMGQDSIWFGDENGAFSSRKNLEVNGYYEPLIGDFDGDGADDIFWYGTGRAPDSVWFGSGSGDFSRQNLVVNGEYEPVVGNFDGDESDDLFWYAAGSDSDSVWFGDRQVPFQRRRDAEIEVAGDYQTLVGDFDSDGYDDIFWYAEGSRLDSVWFGDDTGRFRDTRTFDVAGDYQPFVGDFDGDDFDDVLWYGPGFEPDSLWFGDAGRGFDARTAFDVDPFKTVAEGFYEPVVADFDGNGADDVLWYGPGPERRFNTDEYYDGKATAGDNLEGDRGITVGDDHLWFGKRDRQFEPSASPLVNVNGDYNPFAGDFDGDGHGDLLWYGVGAEPDLVWLGR